MWEPGKKKHPIESAYTHHIVHLEAIKGLIGICPRASCSYSELPETVTRVLPAPGSGYFPSLEVRDQGRRAACEDGLSPNKDQ